MTWEEKVRMAKEANPSLSDEAAAEVVNDLHGLADLAYEQYARRESGLAQPIPNQCQ